MDIRKFGIKCPCCKSEDIKPLILSTEWGFEDFEECLGCGIVFRNKKISESEHPANCGCNECWSTEVLREFKKNMLGGEK